MSKIETVELPIPSNAKSVTIRVKVTPPTGAVLVSPATGNNKPVTFHGPQQIGAVTTNSAFVKIEMIDGATAWELEISGYSI